MQGQGRTEKEAGLRLVSGEGVLDARGKRRRNNAAKEGCKDGQSHMIREEGVSLVSIYSSG